MTETTALEFTTLVLQSHAPNVQPRWIQQCLASVRAWANQSGFHYQCLDDTLFDPVPSALRHKTRAQPVIATDLGRLLWIQRYLKQYQRVIWCDADLLVFSPTHFRPLVGSLGYAVGREVWVQADAKHPRRWRIYTKVHNAFLLFERDNAFLDFYVRHAQQLLTELNGPVPPQFIGPKLLTALHNVVQCPVQETAAMFSPAVIDAIYHAQRSPDSALSQLLRNSPQRPVAANLCASLSGGQAHKLEQVVAYLLNSGLDFSG